MQTKRDQKHYGDEFKWRVVREVMEGRHSKEAARKIYGIRSNSAILEWMRTFSGKDESQPDPPPIPDIGDMERTREVKELEARVARLEEELQRTAMRADLWQKMVEVAEENLKIDIKKKFGAQLLKRTGKRP